MHYDSRNSGVSRASRGWDWAASGASAPIRYRFRLSETEIVIIFAIESGESIVSDRFGPEDVKEFSALGAAQGLGCSIVASLIIFIVGGVFLDQYFDTTPLLTLIGVAVGLVAAGYQLYELTLVNRKDRPAGPLGRTLEAGLSRRKRPANDHKDSGVQ